MYLLVFDVEGTLFKTNVRLPDTSLDSTIWQSIAHALGADAISAEVETHRKWIRGDYSNYLSWMEDTIEIHRKYGLTEEVFKKLIATAEYNPGVADVLPKIDRSKYEIILVSGGFRELAARAQRDFFIRHAFAACEYLFGDNGFLKGYNLLPCDFEGKVDFIHLMLREYRLDKNHWIFIGDGRNDVAIAKEAPVSFGYKAHSDLKAVSTHCVEHFQDLLSYL